MNRHGRLLGQFMANSVQQDLEYRTSFVINMVNSLIGLGATAIILYAMFERSDTVGGWDFNAVIVLLGVFAIADAVTGLVFRPSLHKVAEYIEQGSMDYMLLKPVNLQFTVSLRAWSIWHVPNLLIGFALVVYGMAEAGTLTWDHAIMALIALGAGLITLYALWAIVTVSAFWFVRISNAQMILYALMGASRFPVTIYPTWLRLMFTFVLPIAFITNVPAEAAVRHATWALVGGSVAVAMISFALSVAAWRIAVRYYTSASS
nr:ABC-2 family transporter protein [uncultured Dongia sp.]